MESHVRSIAKAVSYRLLGSAVTFSVVLVMTRKLDMAAGVGVLDMIMKIGAYYVHERLWHRIPYGKIKPPEYQI